MMLLYLFRNTMEKGSSGSKNCRSEALLRKYHQLTSPLVSLNTSKRQEGAKEELRKNASLRLNAMRNGKTSVYSLEGSDSMADLKASAAVYQIPEFSVPEVNFEVVDRIKSKV